MLAVCFCSQNGRNDLYFTFRGGSSLKPTTASGLGDIN